MNVNPVGWASSSLRLVARLFNDGVNTDRPVLAVRPDPSTDSANCDIALVAGRLGTGATLAQIPDGALRGGNKRGLLAVDWQKNRSVATQVASGDYSTISGGSQNTSSGTYANIGGGAVNSATGQSSCVLGGASCTASGTNSTVTGGQTNTASSNYSFVGGGQGNTAQTNAHATVCGGNGNTASGQYGFIGSGASNAASGSTAIVCGGNTNTASGVSSTVCGGRQNTANSDYSFIGGGRRGTARSIAGYQVFPACDVPIADALGISQSALLLLGRQTTDATATVLTSNTSAATTTNQVILPNNSAYSFSGEVIAGVTGAGNTAVWNFKGAIKRGATAASTAVVGTIVLDRIAYDTGAAAWTVAVTADTTNGGIAVTVTGAAATTIRWVCRISTVEMTY